MHVRCARAPILERSCTRTCTRAIHGAYKANSALNSDTNAFVHVFCLVMRACLHEKNMINVYAATENNDYYLNSVKNRDNFVVNVENRDISVF